MIGNKRNFSLSIWDHEDKFLCLLKAADSDFEGQSYNENFTENINGEKTLSFSIPMYIFGTKDSSIMPNFIPNKIWQHIYNEQKIRYIEYNQETNEQERIEEFVLKSYVESRNGEEKIAECTCESLAVYELGKIGWSITFDTDYVSKYELEKNDDELLTLDYWLRKIFYKETNLGRVSNLTECNYLLQGLQMRNEEGYPINKEYSVDSKGNYVYTIIDEPIATESDLLKYKNELGWTWEIQAKDERRVDKDIISSTLYEKPIVNRYLEVSPDYYKAFSYQKNIGQTDNKKKLLPHPITEGNNTLMYVTDIKKRLISIERSNIYNIIQTLCETFEIWAYFEYHYNEQGIIDERKILFKTEAINEDVSFDFSYGKNLTSCRRTSDSNELVTKLIVPDTESNINQGTLLSIRQAVANPTGENYIYNFKYFFDNGMLTSGESDINSDEFKINVHCGRIKNFNKRISKIQDYLVPLYDRRNNLDSHLTSEQASRTALIDNIQSIQEKINNIPPEQQIINSWSGVNTQYNHIGEMKTVSTTTINGLQRYYIDFGREDIVYSKKMTINEYRFQENTVIDLKRKITIPAFIPRVYKEDSAWTVSINKTIEDNESGFYFDLLSTTSSLGITPVYSTIRNSQKDFISGLILENPLPTNYVRIRYQYAPLAWYYLLIEDYWTQLKKVEEEITKLKNQLQEINNKIISNELILNNVLNEKNKEILQFEKKYKSFIREGYWETSGYQSQIASKELHTNNPTSIYEGLISITTPLKDLNLNDSLSNYKYYFELGNKNSIDIDSISMSTSAPTYTAGGNSILPRYKGNDYEIYLSSNDKILIGIAPSLIDTYEKYNYGKKYYSCTTSYSTGGAQVNENFIWQPIDKDHNPITKEKFIYLTNDNIITDSIKIYGGNSVNTEKELETYTDYSYDFDYAGYTVNGTRVDLNEQTSYSTNFTYDYITKIVLKNTNNSLKYNNFTVTYNEENTLDFLYQDAVKTSEKYAVPKVTYDVGVVDISSLNQFKNYKPRLGQKVPIYDIEMGFNGLQGLITSVSKTLEKPEDTNITIATYETRFEDVFQKLTATMTEIRYNSTDLFNAAESFTKDGAIRENVFQQSLAKNSYEIALGTDNDVTIDKKSGIMLLDNNNNSAVKLIGRGIFLTRDYKGDADSSWISGITGEGINANALITGNIDTKNINIWNASDGQIRFMWNEQGIHAYAAEGISGTYSATTSPQTFVNYNKYVKFNSDGLDFSDDGKSSLKLTWDGLSMQAQNGALALNASDGLKLKDEEDTTRLELGRLKISNSNNYSNIYGLRLRDPSGNVTFQNDSDGNLWLSKHIKIGGNYNDNEYSSRPTAGLVGISDDDNIDKSYQMGIMRDTSNGDIVWKTSSLRFYAGPQRKTQYLENLSLTENDLSSTTKTNYWNKIKDYDPTLSRFKVDSEGNIIASGIDVGGWIGAGKILRSNNFEAILRSNGYNEGFPVIAIGRPNYEDTKDSKEGKNHNFRVAQDGSIYVTKGSINLGDGKFVANSTGVTILDGSINLGNGKFVANSDGKVTAKDINISAGALATFTIDSNEIYIDTEDKNQTYRTFLKGCSESTEKVIGAGLINNPSFYVQNDGYMNASKGKIAGWTIEDNKLFKSTTSGYVALNAPNNATSSSILIQAGTSSKDEDIKFSVAADGKIRATAGKIGDFTIGSGIYYSGPRSTDDISIQQPAVYIGTERIALGGNELSNFSVNNMGHIYAKGGGEIGAFTLGSNSNGGSLYTNEKSTFDNSAEGIYIGNNGIRLGKNFQVTNKGVITISGTTNSKIGSLTIDNDSLSFISITTVGETTEKYKTAIYGRDNLNSRVFEAGMYSWSTSTESKTVTPAFIVNGRGKLTATDADITGQVKANSGRIGSATKYFTITTESATTTSTGPMVAKIYSSKRYIDQSSNGIYLGTNGIALGNNFKVDTTGKITSKSGEIGKWTIDSDKLYSYYTNKNVNYYTGIQAANNSSTKFVFYAGATTSTGDDNAPFYVKADGSVKATKLTIGQDQVTGLDTSLSTLNEKITKIKPGDVSVIGGFTNTNTGDYKGLTSESTTVKYYVGMYAPDSTTSVVFYAGTSNKGAKVKDNQFYVRADGYLKAISGTIGGWGLGGSSLTKNLNNNNIMGLYASTGDSSSTLPMIFIGNKNETTSNTSSTLFKVSSDGSVFFKGGIYGWSDKKREFKKGFTGKEYISIYSPSTDGGDGKIMDVEICNGLIIDTKNVGV